LIAAQDTGCADRHILPPLLKRLALPADVSRGMKPKSGSLLVKFASKAAELYSADLHRFLVRRMHRPDDIQDLAQEVYVRLLKIENGEFVQNPKAYILQTASHVAHDYLEKDRRAEDHVVVDSEMADEAAERLGDDPSCDLARRLSSEEQLNAALAKLSPIHQTVLLMFYREGYSYEEIAQQLKVTIRQVKRYLANAKKELMEIDWHWD
jgi:RNA polymerase sigma-70 factor (ECF subfamily)